MAYKYPDASTKDLILEKMRYYISVAIDKEAFPDPNDLNFQSFYDMAEERIYASLRMMFWKNKVSSQVDDWAVYPFGLRDYVKHWLKQRLPKFLANKIKPKYVRIAVQTSVYHICPHIGVSGKKGIDLHVDFLKGKKDGAKNKV